MSLDKLTKIDGGGISTTSDYRVGVITATKFVGPVEGSITATDASFSGNVSIAGTLTYEDVTNVDSVGVVTARTNILLGDSLKHLGDENTLISFPANDTITAHTSGSERLRITSTGRVAIGTDNTTSATGLTVYRDDTGLGNIVNIEQDGTGDAVLGFAIKGTAAWQFGIDNSDSDKFKISYDGSGLDSSTSVTLDRTGKVGINQTSPYYKLHLNFTDNTTSLSGGGSGNWGGNGIRIENDSTITGAMALIHFRSHSTDWHIGNKKVSASPDKSDFVFIHEGTEEALRITSAGNVGIGTTNPESPLSIFSDAAGEELIHFDMGSTADRRGWKFKQGDTGTQTELVLQADANGKSFNVKAGNGAECFFVHTASSDAYVRITPELHISDTIQHIGDSNTKIRFPAADTFTVETAGSERFRIKSGGEVKIANGGFLTIDTDVSGNYALQEAIRIDDGGGTGDRALQFFEYHHSGARYHRIQYNTNTTTNGSAYTYTQGNYGGSSSIEFNNSGHLTFYTNTEVSSGSTDSITPTERLRIDSSGRLLAGGTGNTDSDIRLYLHNSSAAGSQIQLTGNASGTGNSDGLRIGYNGSGGQIWLFENEYLRFATNNNERLRIDSSGRLLIGHTVASADLHGPQTTTNRSPYFQLHGENAYSAAAALLSWSTSSGSFYSPVLFLGRSGSGTKGTNGIIPSNQTFGSIVFSGDDGTDFVKGAMIEARLDGTPGNDDMPGRLEFHTTPDGAQVPVERLRIASDGKVGINQQSPAQQLDVSGSIKLTAQLMQSMPADFWSQGNTFIELNGVGNLTHMGSYQTCLTSNGYRDSSAQWVSYAINSTTGASQIRLDPTGYILFATEATKSTGSTHNVTEKMRLTSTGQLNLAGNMQLTAANPEIELNNGGPRFRVPSANTLTYHTGGTLGSTNNEVLRITSTGRVGINSTAPSSYLDVQGDGTLAIFGSTDSSYEALMIKNNVSGYPAITNESSPDTLEFRSAGSVQATIDYNNNDTNKYFRVMANAQSGDGTEVFRAQEDGRVGINESAPSAKLEVTVRGDTERGIYITDSDNTHNSPYLRVLGKRNDGNTHQSFSGRILLASLRADAKVNQNRKVGVIMFGGNHTNTSESNILYPASIAAVAGDSYDSATDMPTDLVFYTGSTGRAPNDNNVSSGDERLRIQSTGTIEMAQNIRLVSLPNSTWGAGLKIGGNGNTSDSTYGSMAVTNGNLHLDSRDGSYGVYLNWYGGGNGTYFGNGGGAQRGRIDGAGNLSLSGSYPGSDLRLKENIQNISGATDTIKSLVGKTFTWKSEAGLDSYKRYGFIAQEVQKVVPDLVKDIGCHYFDEDDKLVSDIDPTESDEDRKNKGITQSLTVNNEGVTPILVEAMKELIAKVETLEAEVAALKSS